MELPNSTYNKKPQKVAYATVSQKEYIETLLDKIDATLDDYTTTDWDDLTKEEASELIDEIKDDVTSADAWGEDY